MNKLNEVRQFRKIAGLLKENHPTSDEWYEDFEDGLKNLVHNKYISKREFKYYMDALDHIDPMDNYGHMASGHDAAKEFVDDLRTKTQMDHDNDQYRRETGLEENDPDKEWDEEEEEDTDDSEYDEDELFNPAYMDEVSKFQKIAGIKEDDYSEDPFSNVYDDSESGDTATMGNIDEDDMDKRANQDSKTQYGQGGILNL